MYLLNAKTRKLEYFEGSRIPPYAILSHRWEEEEVLFAEIEQVACRKKKGYRKIDLTCQQALRDGLLYAWIDTCCIDKKSSAELSEAINSMFAWYKDANICYVYLSDVSINESTSKEGFLSSFKKSLWFTRGWTLQELIAPTTITFYDSTWIDLGSRDDLIDAISDASGIDKRVFVDLERDQQGDFCAAYKMSWASRRETTRVEDEAYCLLGIFGVNMPLMYGEGRQAFRRLQEGILKKSGDISIFGQDGDSSYRRESVFAESPRRFQSSFRKIGLFKIDNIFDPNKCLLWSGGLTLTVSIRAVGYDRFLLPVRRSAWDQVSCVCLFRCSEPDNLYSIRDYKLITIGIGHDQEGQYGWYQRTIDLVEEADQSWDNVLPKYHGFDFGRRPRKNFETCYDVADGVWFMSRAGQPVAANDITWPVRIPEDTEGLFLKDTEAGLAGFVDISLPLRGCRIRIFMGHDIDGRVFCLSLQRDIALSNHRKLADIIGYRSTMAWLFEARTARIKQVENDLIIESIHRMADHPDVKAAKLVENGFHFRTFRLASRWHMSTNGKIPMMTTLRIDNLLDIDFEKHCSARWLINVRLNLHPTVDSS